MPSSIGQIAFSLLAVASSINAQAIVNNQFRIVGQTGVSAQQMFLSTENKVVIIDKTEGNGNNFNIDGHPAYGSEYTLANNSVRAMNLVSNTFCAGGSSLGDGRWLNVGGNQAVGPGGLASTTSSYDSGDGGRSVRVFQPCDTGRCDWQSEDQMTTRRWYPTLETLEDGSIIIIGGCDWGGYVNDAGQNNPTYEFYPSKGSPLGLNILTSTLPANLYPLTWLLPSGRLFINSNRGNELFDYKNQVEYPLANTPHSVRTYPGSAANAMMPLTPANNYTATIWFCGGTDLQPDQFVLTFNIANYEADNTCISITPDEDAQWEDMEDLPEPRSMGSMIALPDGRYVILEGVGRGTAGYGNTSWAVGQSYAQDPILAPLYLDPSLPAGSRLYRDGMSNSSVPRLYHSTAILLPDGSVFTAGSNPNADFVGNNTRNNPYPTTYTAEVFYPSYFNNTRPQPSGLPESLSYGGSYFNVTLNATDIQASHLGNTKVMIVRTGFATHAVNFGQRTVQLNSTATLNADGSATLFVSQVPGPAILAPGPAMLFVVVDGTPSIGKIIMVGNGQIGQQTVSRQAALPANAGWSTTGSTTVSPSSASAVSNIISGLPSSPTVLADAGTSAASSISISSFLVLLVLALLMQL